jgi:hypothetical protein
VIAVAKNASRVAHQGHPAVKRGCLASAHVSGYEGSVGCVYLGGLTRKLIGAQGQLEACHPRWLIGNNRKLVSGVKTMRRRRTGG